MEDMSACPQLSEALHRQVGEQKAALETLGEVFAQEAKRLCQYEQAQCLRDLRCEVMRRVECIDRMERDAAYRYSDVRLMRGLAAFALGTLRAAVVNSEDPLSVGLRLAKGDLERKQSYGTVLVVIGPGGVPDDVNVISLSRWARESGRSEARIEAALKAKGYRLMTSQDFSRFMEELESRVLGEMVALPVATSSLAQESADGVPEQLLPQQVQQQGSS